MIGDDIRKWKVAEHDRWLIYLPHGVDIRGLGSVIDHLRPYRRELQRRATEQEWYELQQPQEASVPAFENPKIVYPEIAKESRFAYDLGGAFTNNKAFVIATDDLYLLGVLNSDPAWQYIKSVCAVLGDENKGGRAMLQWVNFSRLPIPEAKSTDRADIADRVQKCLDAKGVGCEKWEAEINERVAALYGL